MENELKPSSLNECLERLQFDIAILNMALKEISELAFEIHKYVAHQTVKSMAT